VKRGQQRYVWRRVESAGRNSAAYAFLAKRVLYNMPKPHGDVEISFYVHLLS